MEIAEAKTKIVELRAELAQKENRKNPRTLSMYRCKPKPKK